MAPIDIFVVDFMFLFACVDIQNAQIVQLRAGFFFHTLCGLFVRLFTCVENLIQTLQGDGNCLQFLWLKKFLIYVGSFMI